MSGPLLVRPIFEALEVNTRDLLASSADRFAGSVDAESLVGSYMEQGDGYLARVMKDFSYAHGVEIGNDNDDGSNECCDICTKTDEEWDKFVQEKIAETKQNGMSPTGLTQLTSPLHHRRDTVPVRYQSPSPAHVRPMELRLLNNASPVRAKPRQYPPEKRQFVQTYVAQLLSLNLVKPAKRTARVSAPLPAPKKPPAMYRLTVDYRPINAATVRSS